MADVTVPFPRGFLLCTSPVDVPRGFVPGPVLPNFFLHPWCASDVATDADGRYVILLGTCVPITHGQTERPSKALLSALQRSEAEFLDALAWYSGRHAMVYGNVGTTHIVSDATAMRSLFYANGVVASHARLVECALGGSIDTTDVPFRYGYPGNRVPYARTRLLTPNTVLDLTNGRVRRFWPTQSPPARSVDQSAEEVLGWASTALQNIARDRPVKMALTAGLDSRALLATALHAGIEFVMYTYGDGPDTAIDRAVAAAIARHVGVAHFEIPTKRPGEALASQLDKAHYAQHHRGAVGPLMEWFGDPRTVALTANLLEIGRSFYKGARSAGVAPPLTAEGMSVLHLRVMGRAVKGHVAAWGEDRFLQLSRAAFQEFIDATAFPGAAELVDPFDLFYWEHRMSAWHGASMVERDFYAEPFIPFNARAIFRSMLGVPQPERDSGAVLRSLITRVKGSLLEIPINPKEWPAA